MIDPKETIQELRHELTTSKHAANQKEESLNEIIKSLRARDENSSAFVGILTCPSLTSMSLR